MGNSVPVLVKKEQAATDRGWKARYDSMAQAADNLREQAIGLQKEAMALRDTLRHAQAALDIQKKVVRDMVGQDNAEEIGRLREKVKALGGNLD